MDRPDPDVVEQYEVLGEVLHDAFQLSGEVAQCAQDLEYTDLYDSYADQVSSMNEKIASSGTIAVRYSGIGFMPCQTEGGGYVTCYASGEDRQGVIDSVTLLEPAELEFEEQVDECEDGSYDLIDEYDESTLSDEDLEDAGIELRRGPKSPRLYIRILLSEYEAEDHDGDGMLVGGIALQAYRARLFDHIEARHLQINFVDGKLYEEPVLDPEEIEPTILDYAKKFNKLLASKRFKDQDDLAKQQTVDDELAMINNHVRIHHFDAFLAPSSVVTVKTGITEDGIAKRETKLWSFEDGAERQLILEPIRLDTLTLGRDSTSMTVENKDDLSAHSGLFMVCDTYAFEAEGCEYKQVWVPVNEENLRGFFCGKDFKKPCEF